VPRWLDRVLPVVRAEVDDVAPVDAQVLPYRPAHEPVPATPVVTAKAVNPAPTTDDERRPVGAR
jgi:hypothetical protein